MLAVRQWALSFRAALDCKIRSDALVSSPP